MSGTIHGNNRSVLINCILVAPELFADLLPRINPELFKYTYHIKSFDCEKINSAFWRSGVKIKPDFLFRPPSEERKSNLYAAEKLRFPSRIPSLRHLTFQPTRLIKDGEGERPRRREDCSIIFSVFCCAVFLLWPLKKGRLKTKGNSWRRELKTVHYLFLEIYMHTQGVPCRIFSSKTKRFF